MANDHIKRIVDANINRLTEGLRVAEEYFRFVVQDASVSISLKDLRHRVHTILPEEMKDMPLFRDSVNDPGADLDESAETRSSSKDVALANCKRAEEALRVVEEYLKVAYPDQAALFKEMRFDLYSIEKTFFLQIEKLRQSRLYIIVTEALCACPYEETVRQVLDNGADVIQLREKEMSGKEFLTKAETVQKLMDGYDTLLVINDRPDIARICEADSIHVGQDDLPPDRVRSVFASGFVGMSTHSVEQVIGAMGQGADYIGVGPVYNTQTKQGAEPIGLDTAVLMAQKADIPLFAIGGITRDVCMDIKEKGIPGICICSAVISSDNPGKETAYFAGIFK